MKFVEETRSVQRVIQFMSVFCGLREAACPDWTKSGLTKNKFTEANTSLL